MTQGSRDRYRCSFEMQSYLLGGELERRLNQSQFKNERKGKAPANIIFAYHYMHKARENLNQSGYCRRYGQFMVAMTIMTIITKTMLKLRLAI